MVFVPVRCLNAPINLASALTAFCLETYAAIRERNNCPATCQRCARGLAGETKNLIIGTGLFTLGLLPFNKCFQLAAMDYVRARIRNTLKPIIAYPAAHCCHVNTEQVSYLLNVIAVIILYQPRIMGALARFLHGTPPLYMPTESECCAIKARMSSTRHAVIFTPNFTALG